MENKKFYSNGIKVRLDHFSAAREVAIREGLYRTWGNFGPLFKGRNDMPKKPKEIHRIDGWEFFVYEVEMMSMSMDLEVSKPRLVPYALYRPARKNNKNNG